MSGRQQRAHKGSDVGGASHGFRPQVRVSTGFGLTKRTAKIHLRRKIEFYKARNEYRAALKESASARVMVFAETAVACLALDEDKPL